MGYVLNDFEIILLYLLSIYCVLSIMLSVLCVLIYIIFVIIIVRWRQLFLLYRRESRVSERVRDQFRYIEFVQRGQVGIFDYRVVFLVTCYSFYFRVRVRECVSYLVRFCWCFRQRLCYLCVVKDKYSWMLQGVNRFYLGIAVSRRKSRVLFRLCRDDWVF